MTKSPDAFRTISEVAEWLDTPAHVLRFWESKFTQVKPVKRAGGRRYYRPDDMALLGGIKMLLHEQGMTIKGAQKLLREKGVKYVASIGPSPIGATQVDLVKAVAEPATKNVVPMAPVPAPEVPDAEIVVEDAAEGAEPEVATAAPQPEEAVDPIQAEPEVAAPAPIPEPDAAPAEPALTEPGFLATTTALPPGALMAKTEAIVPLIARLEAVEARMRAR